MNAFKEKCIELRKQGLTLPEIMKATGRPKTSIYFHIQKIELSAGRKEEIRIKSIKRLLKLASDKKGISKREFIKFDQWTREAVCLVSHLLFDGEIYRGCIYNNKNISLIKKVENAMKTIYSFEPKRYTDPKTGVLRISYHNVALGAFMEKKTAELIKDICELPKNLKTEFIRAFFDDEGCIDFRPKENRRQVRGYQKNVSILFLIKKLLLDFDIESKIVKPNEVVVSGKGNLVKFREYINFFPGVRLNGNRSNSIWKKPLEKRVLLEQAINSFKNY